MPQQHSAFLAAYEASPRRPPLEQLARFDKVGSSVYLGLPSVVPDLRRAPPARRLSRDIKLPAPDDFFMNRNGRTYAVVPALVFVRPSSAQAPVAARVREGRAAAAEAAEAAVARRFYERIGGAPAADPGVRAGAARARARARAGARLRAHR